MKVKYKQHKLKLKKLYLAILAIVSPTCCAYNVVPIYTNNNEIAFYLNFYSSGETAYLIQGDYNNLNNVSSTFDLNNDDILSIQEGFNYWANVLDSNSPMQIAIIANEMGINNAFATASFDENYQFLAPNIANSIINNDALAGAFIVNKWTFTETGHLPYAHISLLPHDDLPSLSATSVHECAHILGMSSLATANDFSNNNLISSNAQSQFDKHLYDLYGNNLSNAKYHKEINYNDDIKEENKDSNYFISYGYQNPDEIFDKYNHLVYESGVYFSGENVLKVLNGALLEQANSITNNLYPGIPVEGFESENNPDWSHFELQGSLLSHQVFRNWNTLMEIEMAAFEDLGYKIDRRKYFGYSIYNSGTPSNRYNFINTNPYYERNANGSDYLDGIASNAAYGIGLHIYGSYTDVTQMADILTNGIYSAGIRLEGINNNLKIDKDTVIHTNGNFSYGLLVDFGKEHEISHYGNIEALGLGGIGVAEALGLGGIGVAFDFGTFTSNTIPTGIGSYFVYGYSYYYQDEQKNQWSFGR